MSQHSLGEIGTLTSIDGQFEWKLERFSYLPTEIGVYYRSTPFNFAGNQWFLELFPNGTKNNQHFVLNLYVTMYSKATTYFTLGVKTVKGKLETWKQDCICPVSSYYGTISLLSDYIKRSDIVQRKSELLPSDCLTLRFTMSTTAPKTYRDAWVQTDAPLKEVLTEGKESSEKQGVEKALQDFSKLFASSENCDITVQVKEVTFKVHSNILSARSPVISAMFQHDTAEKASNKISIVDCEPEIFKEYLHYIYTGSVQCLTEQNACSLYRVADKYLAEDLKLSCLKYIQDTLCVQTFCNTVQLALTYDETCLLKLAMDFATENIRSIINSIEWQNFIREYPNDANEILIKSLNSPCEIQKSK